jgi:hypothetical protein
VSENEGNIEQAREVSSANLGERERFEADDKNKQCMGERARCLYGSSSNSNCTATADETIAMHK